MANEELQIPPPVLAVQSTYKVTTTFPTAV